MKSTNRKAEQSQATRAALLRVARDLFGERGYSGASREEIVARAGVTRGALQYHFGRKEDLFRAVLDEEERALAVKIASAALAYDDAWQRLKAGCQAFLDACLDPAMQRIVLLDAPSVV